MASTFLDPMDVDITSERDTIATNSGPVTNLPESTNIPHTNAQKVVDPFALPTDHAKVNDNNESNPRLRPKSTRIQLKNPKYSNDTIAEKSDQPQKPMDTSDNELNQIKSNEAEKESKTIANEAKPKDAASAGGNITLKTPYQQIMFGKYFEIISKIGSRITARCTDCKKVFIGKDWHFDRHMKVCIFEYSPLNFYCN